MNVCHFLHRHFSVVRLALHTKAFLHRKLGDLGAVRPKFLAVHAHLQEQSVKFRKLVTRGEADQFAEEAGLDGEVFFAELRQDASDQLLDHVEPVAIHKKTKHSKSLRIFAPQRFSCAKVVQLTRRALLSIVIAFFLRSRYRKYTKC